jgi:hypothetical protein
MTLQPGYNNAMKNPRDILGVDPHGAKLRALDPRDYKPEAPEVGLAGAPFNWNQGYDVEADISSMTGSFNLPTKDQGQSGSCGGQAMAYYGQVLSAYYPHAPAERSAKFLYSQAFSPGGGSDDRTLAKLAISQGFAPEAACVSYDRGAPPMEGYMERPQDITPQARLQASGDKISLAYVFPTTSLDDIASLMPLSKGGVLLLRGSNNGTWLSSVPRPPTRNESLWTHYMFMGKARIYQGQKGVWAKQSWGQEAAPDTNGWQFLNEEYFASGNILSGLGMLYNPKPSAAPHHVFSVNLHLGDTGPEVTALQTMLAYDGEFNLAANGIYGPITAQALFHFQLKYQLASVATLDELGGAVCGPATRAKLNTLT